MKIFNLNINLSNYLAKIIEEMGLMWYYKEGKYILFDPAVPEHQRWPVGEVDYNAFKVNPTLPLTAFFSESLHSKLPQTA